MDKLLVWGRNTWNHMSIKITSNRNTWKILLLKIVCINDHIYPTPPIWHKVNFKRSLTGLNSEFSFSYTSCLTKAEESSLPYYLPIVGGGIIRFIPFPRVLVLREMQSVSSRIWTRVTVSISYDDNHYTTGTSIIYTTDTSINIVCINNS